MNRLPATVTGRFVMPILVSAVTSAVLIVLVLTAVQGGVSAAIIVPAFVAVSVVEMVVWKSRAQQSRQAAAAGKEPRLEALRVPESRRRAAIIDETTGLRTRWYFDRRIEEEAARCIRYKHSMTVVVLRVDAVDLTTFSLDGWQKRSLEAAQRAATVVREVDISAALSPFEFAICLVHCDRDGALSAVSRMARGLPDFDCEAGVASFPDEGFEAAALLELARARMRHLGQEELRATA